MKNNFVLTCADTDSITVCKPNGTVFEKEEIIKLTNELNSLFPDTINWEFEFNYPKMLVLKAKNYCMLDNNNKIKIKGSALKSSTLEPKLKEMLNEFINAFMTDRTDTLVSIYHKYIKEASQITDMKPWAKKMTLSAKTYSSERANETKVIQAIQGSEYVEGDKIYVYFTEDGSLRLVEKFDGNYDKTVFYKKIYNTSQRFSTMWDTSIFLNYSLKRNKKLLEEL